MNKEEKQVWNLVKKHPDELGFVLQAEDYSEYISTYTDIGMKAEDADLTEEEFNVIKNYFKSLGF